MVGVQAPNRKPFDLIKTYRLCDHGGAKTQVGKMSLWLRNRPRTTLGATPRFPSSRTNNPQSCRWGDGRMPYRLANEAAIGNNHDDYIATRYETVRTSHSL